MTTKQLKNESNDELKKVTSVEESKTENATKKPPTQQEINEFIKLRKKQIQRMKSEMMLQLEPIEIENELLEAKVRNMELTIRQAAALENYVEALEKIKDFNEQLTNRSN